MPGPRGLWITDGTSGSRGSRDDKRRRVCPAKRLVANGACPVKRDSAKQGRADGPSACPGGSPSEPGGVSTKATIPGDMQQAEKSIRVRSAGGFLRLRRSRGLFGPAGSCVPRGHTPPSACSGCTEPWVAFDNPWRRGRGEPSSVPHAPFGGDEGQGDRQSLRRIKSGSDFARLVARRRGG